MTYLPTIENNWRGFYHDIRYLAENLRPMSVLEFGTGYMISTRAFLGSGVQRLVTVDQRDIPRDQIALLSEVFPQRSIEFVRSSVEDWKPNGERFDLVLVDAHTGTESEWHRQTQVQLEHVRLLEPHYIVVDDCCVDGVMAAAIASLGQPAGKLMGPTGVWWWMR